VDTSGDAPGTGEPAGPHLPPGRGPAAAAPATAAPATAAPATVTPPAVPAEHEEVEHEEIAQALKEHSAKKGRSFNILVTLIEIGGSIGLFHLARSLGASDVVSYLAGSIGPVVGGLLIWIKARTFSGASAAIFAFTAISAVIALIGSTNPKVLLYKDCATTALIGLIFLGSCVLARRPVVFYMAQRYGSDGSHDGMALFDTLWNTYRNFRTTMYLISYLWAALFLIQAAVTALIIRQTSFSAAYNYDQILPLVATGLGIVGSVALGRRSQKRGEAARAGRPGPA
jgi:hypothetical protein